MRHPSADHLIAVVEDEAAIRDILTYQLAALGYQTIEADNGQSGIELISANQPSLVILDRMLPVLDGDAVLSQMRASDALRATPVLMLTARDTPADIVTALRAGADDYLTKPFRSDELIARVEALLRRALTRSFKQEQLQYAEIELDRQQFTVHVSRESVDVTPSEFELLYLLAANPGRVWTRLQLLDQIRDDGTAVTERTIDAHIRSLRAKLGTARGYIETVHRVGYRMSYSGAADE